MILVVRIRKFYNFSPSFPHSTVFVVDLLLLNYHKRAADATYKNYFPVSDALEYTLNYKEWIKDVLKHYELILERAHIKYTFFSSIFSYD
jgi:hypothetical protein